MVDLKLVGGSKRSKYVFVKYLIAEILETYSNFPFQNIENYTQKNWIVYEIRQDGLKMDSDFAFTQGTYDLMMELHVSSNAWKVSHYQVEPSQLLRR